PAPGVRSGRSPAVRHRPPPHPRLGALLRPVLRGLLRADRRCIPGNGYLPRVPDRAGERPRRAPARLRRRRHSPGRPGDLDNADGRHDRGRGSDADRPALREHPRAAHRLDPGGPVRTGAIAPVTPRHAGGVPLLGVFFALLALGPFIWIGGVNTRIPTPWALLRYVPVIGFVRSPARFAVVVMMLLSAVFALAVTELRRRHSRPGLIAAGIGALL